MLAHARRRRVRGRAVVASVGEHPDQSGIGITRRVADSLDRDRAAVGRPVIRTQVESKVSVRAANATDVHRLLSASLKAVVDDELGQRDTLGPVGARAIEWWGPKGKVAIEAEANRRGDLNRGGRRNGEVALKGVELIDDDTVADREMSNVLHATRGGPEGDVGEDRDLRVVREMKLSD